MTNARWKPKGIIGLLPAVVMVHCVTFARAGELIWRQVASDGKVKLLHMIRHAKKLLIPTLIALGLVTGFFREITLAYLFGTSREIEIFRVAFGPPSILGDSVAVSFVSVLIPILVSRSINAGIRLALWATILITLLLTIMGILTMPWQARILAPGITGADQDSLIFAGRLCWISLSMIILSLPLRASMSLDGRLSPAAAASLIRSGSFIAILILLISLGSDRNAISAAWSAVFASFLLLFFHWAMIRSGQRPRFTQALLRAPRMHSLRPIIVSLLTVFIMQLMLSGGRLLDRAVASTFEVGTLSAIEYSYALIMAIGAIIATSMNIVLAPRIGVSLSGTGKLPRHFWRYIIAMTVIATICGGLFSLNAALLVEVVFERGAFDTNDTLLTASVLKLHGLALGPLVLGLIMIQVLILSGGHRFLIPIALLKLAAKAAALYILLDMGYGLNGIAISLSIAELVTTIAMLLMVKRSLSSQRQKKMMREVS